MQGHSSIFIFGIDISPLLNQNLTILIGPRPQLLTVVLYRRRSRFSIDTHAFGQVPFAVLILLAAVAVQIEGFMADGITSGPSGLVSHLDIPLANQP